VKQNGRSKINNELGRTMDTCTGVQLVGNVHFVDAYGANFLFRGAQPLIQNGPGTYDFNYQGLRCAIQQAAESEGFEMPPDYRILDVDLMQCSNADEIAKILTERNFFRDNPDLGSFVWWDTSGTPICPATDPWSGPEAQPYCSVELDNWLGDQLVARTDMLREFLIADGPPTVIFVHCYGGDDRTGERMGAYYLRHMHRTWDDVNQLNTRFAGGPIGCNNYRALYWYAYHLNYALGYELDLSVPYQCNDGGNRGYHCPELPAK
jgi:hypothetical protein